MVINTENNDVYNSETSNNSAYSNNSSNNIDNKNNTNHNSNTIKVCSKNKTIFGTKYSRMNQVKFA